MVALRIKDIKTFMAKLLNSEIFDGFLVEEVQIQTYNNFVIDGHMNRSFFTKEELEDPEIFPYEYSAWKIIKPLVFQIIKGKKVPGFLKITLLLAPEKACDLLEKKEAANYIDQLKAFVLTVKFDSGGLLLTSGTSFTTFIMDKTPDNIWDQALCKFLTHHQIDYDVN